MVRTRSISPPPTVICAAALDVDRRTRLRQLLDEAYDGDFSDADWAHARGGWHLWCELDGVIVSHAAVVPRRLQAGTRWLDCGYVEAVATAAGQRRRGLASRVMEAAGAMIRERYALGALSTDVQRFYARSGWEPWRGPTFVETSGGRLRTPEDDDGIMILRTPRTPPLDLGGPIACTWREGDVW